MSTPAPRKRTRKSPDARRAEILDAAARIALAEGLEGVTLRRIAEDLGVRPGLISHYFPVAEDLVAEAFAGAATSERDALLPPDGAEGTPTARLARFFEQSTGADFDYLTRLWINARHLSRYSPVLAGRVADQEVAWRAGLAALVQDGVDAGEFRTDDPHVVALRILVVLDGLGASANTGNNDLPPSVARMGVTLAEADLGLPYGALGP